MCRKGTGWAQKKWGGRGQKVNRKRHAKNACRGGRRELGKKTEKENMGGLAHGQKP